MAAAAPIAGIAGLIGQGAELIGGISKRKKEKAAQRAELGEGIATATEDIAGTREQQMLAGQRTTQVLGAQRRETQTELGGQTAGFAGSGVAVGAGGSASALRSATQEIRGRERKSIQQASAIEQKQFGREIGRLERRRGTMETALGKIKKKPGLRGLLGL